MKWIDSIGSVVVSTLLLAACSSVPQATAPEPAAAETAAQHAAPPPQAGVCSEIAKACHDVDSGSGETHECHLLGHDRTATPERCAERREACLAACKAAPPRGHHQH